MRQKTGFRRKSATICRLDQTQLTGKLLCMSIIASAHALSVSLGARSIFNNLSLSIHEGERVAIVGSNGSGKSTLLKILAGHLKPDHGQCAVKAQARVGFVGQDDDFPIPRMGVGAYLRQRASSVLLEESEVDRSVGFWMGRLGFSVEDVAIDQLSGGWRKKLNLAAALVCDPELLLLDEPTNHLDMASIAEVESILLSTRKAVVFVSHDRWFLERVSQRVIELGHHFPDGLMAVKGSYTDYLQERERLWQQMQNQQEVLANQVRRELEWLRRGPQARTTKAKARQERAIAISAQLDAASARLRNPKVDLNFATTQGRRRLLAARNVKMEYDGRILFDHLDVDLYRGQCLALLGANGCGKSTLLRVLVGEVAPREGQVEWADNIKIRYFDQKKEHLDDSKTVREALVGEGDFVIVGGKSLHVAAYARRFLLRPDQLSLRVSQLSGGERVRLILARFMTEPADILVLDEPTNDLDLEAIQSLEFALGEFTGGIILVSHDRLFVDGLADKCLALNEGGPATFYATLEQWLKAQQQSRIQNEKTVAAPKGQEIQKPRARRLSYMEKREWEQMEKRIAEAEEVLEHWRAEVEHPKVRIDPVRLKQAFEQMSSAQGLVDQLYERWAELERIQNGGTS